MALHPDSSAGSGGTSGYARHAGRRLEPNRPWVRYRRVVPVPGLAFGA